MLSCVQLLFALPCFANNEALTRAISVDASFALPFAVPDYIRDQQFVIEAILQQMGPATRWRRAPMEVSSHESNIDLVVTNHRSI